MSHHVVAAVQDPPPGAGKLVHRKGRPIAIFNIAGEYFGLLNKCPHQGAGLCDGTLAGLLEAPEPGQYIFHRKGEILRCPWHGWEFAIRTGQSYRNPTRVQAKSYKVEIEDGIRVMKGPYVPRRFPSR